MAGGSGSAPTDQGEGEEEGGGKGEALMIKENLETIDQLKREYKKNYYSLDEIKEIFNIYRVPGEFEIEDDEYEIFCIILRILKKRIIDKVEKEIYFFISQKACYLNLESKSIKNKKGIIFINRDIFNISDNRCKAFTVHHEIAHYILGHKNIDNSKEIPRFESEADKLAHEWWDEFY